MKRQWQIRRQFQPTVDGARRWDHTYQHLMQWSQPTEATPAPVPSTPTQDLIGGDVYLLSAPLTIPLVCGFVARIAQRDLTPVELICHGLDIINPGSQR